MPVRRGFRHMWHCRTATLYLGLYGKYHFYVDEAHARKGLRQLWSPGRRG